eukprot:993096_1
MGCCFSHKEVSSTNVDLDDVDEFLIDPESLKNEPFDSLSSKKGWWTWWKPLTILLCCFLLLFIVITHKSSQNLHNGSPGTTPPPPAPSPPTNQNSSQNLPNGSSEVSSPASAPPPPTNQNSSQKPNNGSSEVNPLPSTPPLRTTNQNSSQNLHSGPSERSLPPPTQPLTTNTSELDSEAAREKQDGRRVERDVTTSGDDSLSLKVRAGILTIADDMLKQEGKAFLDMVEKLAEKKLRLEEKHMTDRDYHDDEGLATTPHFCSGGTHSHCEEGSRRHVAVAGSSLDDVIDGDLGSDSGVVGYGSDQSKLTLSEAGSPLGSEYGDKELMYEHKINGNPIGECIGHHSDPPHDADGHFCRHADCDELDPEAEDSEAFYDDAYTDEEELLSDDERPENLLEESQRMFELFAAKLFHQRVLKAYLELVAEQKEQALLLEEEEERLIEERRRVKRKEKRKKQKIKAKKRRRNNKQK